MAFPTHNIDILSDGSIEPLGIPHPPTLPDPVVLPDGFIVGPERNGKIARGRHDIVPRSEKLKLTNEIEVLRPELDNGSGVDIRSKITFKLGNNIEWVNEFYRLNGPWVTERLFSKGVGWFDTKFPAFSCLSTGGNLHEVLAGGFSHIGWAAINYQKFPNSPYGLDYFKFPHLVIKQTLVSKELRILIDKGALGGYGDTYIPKVANEQPYHATWRRDNHNGLEFLPDLPFETELCGVPVTVDKFCFWGSNTYGLIGGLWYTLEEMLVIGNYEEDPGRGGNQDDRRVYVTDWMETCPPPVIGWTRQE